MEEKVGKKVKYKRPMDEKNVTEDSREKTQDDLREKNPRIKNKRKCRKKVEN